MTRQTKTDDVDPHWQVAACEGKHRFETPQLARRAIHKKTHTAVEPYRCKFCGGWHIGNSINNGRKVRVAT